MSDESVKCSYCKVEIDTSESPHVKIPIEGTQRFSFYHNGCYERYLRRNA